MVTPGAPCRIGVEGRGIDARIEIRVGHGSDNVLLRFISLGEHLFMIGMALGIAADRRFGI